MLRDYFKASKGITALDLSSVNMNLNLKIYNLIELC